MLKPSSTKTWPVPALLKPDVVYQGVRRSDRIDQHAVFVILSVYGGVGRTSLWIRYRHHHGRGSIYHAGIFAERHPPRLEELLVIQWCYIRQYVAPFNY